MVRPDLFWGTAFYSSPVRALSLIPVTCDRWLRAALDRLMPPQCGVCRQSAEDQGLCAVCFDLLPHCPTRCRACGVTLLAPAALCNRCLLALPAYTATWVAFDFEDNVQGLIHRFKLQGDLATGRSLAQAMSRQLQAMQVPQPDCLVPVPLHWWRQLRRGFNQSEWLCHDLCRLCADCHAGLSWQRLLRRRRSTRSQRALDADQRLNNVRGAFALRPGVVVPPYVALVDDVMTTGATLHACAQVLREGGAQRVDVWVLARA